MHCNHLLEHMQSWKQVQLRTCVSRVKQKSCFVFLRPVFHGATWIFQMPVIRQQQQARCIIDDSSMSPSPSRSAMTATIWRKFEVVYRAHNIRQVSSLGQFDRQSSMEEFQQYIHLLRVATGGQAESTLAQEHTYTRLNTALVLGECSE
jgi:hypothetical protein